MDLIFSVKSYRITIEKDNKLTEAFLMREFLDKNGRLIWRLVLNQIGLTVFGLMTSMAASALDVSMSNGDGVVRRTCMIWVSVFSILFYMYIDYMAIKEEGQRDKIRADAGRIKLDIWRGAKIALCAGALNVLLAVFIFVFGLLGAENGPALEWAGGISGSAKMIAAIIQAMYWGVMLGWSGAATIGEVTPFAFILIPLPAIAISTVAYILGTREFSLVKNIKKLFTPESK